MVVEAQGNSFDGDDDQDRHHMLRHRFPIPHAIFELWRFALREQRDMEQHWFLGLLESHPKNEWTPKPLMSLSFNKQQINHVFSLHMFIVGFPPETGGSEWIFQSSVRDVCLADVTIPHMFSETRTPQQIIRDQHIQHPTIATSQFLLRRITYFFPSSNSLHMSLHTGFQGLTLALRKITGAGNITVLIGPSLKLTFDIAPENKWLEDEPFLLGCRPIFRRCCY